MRQHELVKQFLKRNEESLRVIARWKKQTLEEVQHLIWLIALELEQTRGTSVDFNLVEEKRNLLREINKTYNRERRRGSRLLSLDFRWPDEDGAEGPSLLDSTRAPDDSNPLEALLQEEDRAARLSAIARFRTETYSQFAAYVVLFFNFDFIKDDVAVHLAVTSVTLCRRVHQAYFFTGKQRSLFDRILLIDSDFLPPPRLAFPKRQSHSLVLVQGGLEF